MFFLKQVKENNSFDLNAFYMFEMLFSSKIKGVGGTVKNTAMVSREKDIFFIQTESRTLDKVCFSCSKFLI